MKITILTLFPKMFKGPFEYSIVKRAIDKKLLDIRFVDIRDYGEGKHKMVDDTEYGGGVGMLLKVNVLHKAIEASRIKKGKELILLTSATGKTYNQKAASKLSKYDHLIIICGHYEGFDERIKKYINEEVSVGDYILTGGEIPAMLIADSVARLIPGVLPKDATIDESFSTNDNMTLLEYPHYTKPKEFNGDSVPDVLLSGNHKEIKKWRVSNAIKVTKKLRPDLLK